MFRRIEAVGYRCLREISQPLDPFQILVGANASGKSTFFDTIRFLNDFMRDGLDAAVRQRTSTLQDLVWGRRGTTFRFTAEIDTPSAKKTSTRILYTVAFAFDGDAGKIEISDESATLLRDDTRLPVMARSGNRVHYTTEKDRREFVQDRPRNQSSLWTLPMDDDFPALAFMRDFLREDVLTVSLDTKELAAPSPGFRDGEALNTGASLAWQIAELNRTHPRSFKEWTSHVRTALPDVCKIESVLRQWDNRRFVRIQYENGLQVPSWMLSEGTLRLLALTILAYLPDFQGVYMIEEPENGVHPAALETIYQSLSSVYNAQVLVATHSPVLLSMASPEQILCFSKTSEGTKIVRGDQHPALKDWQGEVSLGTMVASGILDA